MSQFYDQASLVMVPSGYKAGKVYSQKPLTTDGQLTFTRTGDTATRVNADGLVEKVRTNVLTYSNDFSNADWVKDNGATVTAGQSGYDGSLNAWKLEAPTAGGSRSTYQWYSASAPLTFSVYAKAGTTDWVRINLSGIGNQFFNLANGTTGSGSGIPYSITPAGNGYYRISISGLTGSISGAYIFLAAGDLDTNVSAGDNIYIQNAQLETGDIATQYIPTTSAAVSVGPVANLPRIDYTGATGVNASGCGKLLLEPQRVNLALFSESFDNAAWSNVEATTVSANNATSPDGYINADKLTPQASNDFHRIYQALNVTASTPYTFSVFVKRAGYDYFLIRSVDSSINNVGFDLVNGTVTYEASGYSGFIESFGNDWYRIGYVRSFTTTSITIFLRPNPTAVTDNNISTYTGNGTSGIYAWGAQLEAGSYATSYIPTLGAAVTRGADSITKSAISGLIGQTEGVIFMDFVYSTPDQTRININSGSSQNWVFFSGPESVTNSRVYIRASGIVAVDTTTNLTGVFVVGQRYKIALAYKSGDWAIAINGTIRTSGTQTFTFNAPLTTAIFSGNLTSEPSAQQGINNVNQALLFTSRLSNADLETLTTL